MSELVGIVGNRGAGKTCLMTSLLYMDFKLGRKIITNYSVKFKARYMSFEKIATLPEELKYSTIGLDELGIGADSRQFFSKRNTNLGKLITQIRKRKCLMYYTVQRLNLVDKRIREQTDYYFLLEKSKLPDKFNLTIIYGDSRELLSKSTFNGRPFYNLYNTNEIIDLEGVET